MADISDYLIDCVQNSWTEPDLQLAGATTVTHAAQAKRHHVVMKCDASFDLGTQSGLLQVKFGSTVIAHKIIFGAGALDFGPLGMENPNANEAVSAVLAAGAGGVTGYLVLTGYTTGPRAGEAF
jgi:hypothetical protein